MKRRWFHDERGFHRNFGNVEQEMQRSRNPVTKLRRMWELDRMHREHTLCWTKPALGRGDVEGVPVPFREAYPDSPSLWTLDDPHYTDKLLERALRERPTPDPS